VRRARPSSVTVCHVDDDCWGLRREDQREVLGMVVVTPVALCVPSTPAEIGDSTVVLLFGALLPFWSEDWSDGGEVGATPTFL